MTLHQNSTITLSRHDYWDKVYACWLGKNCGGTLGAPLEVNFAHEEPFAIDWYPEIREGGIPNDDLEMQLIWLKAVEERGFALTVRDLAQYWLDHIGYNWDEYGFSKTNLRLGLLPPVSGYYNNWFRDFMGAPIRSEIWACLAPGVPALAVRYAREDALVDHAGGEGMWGEMFNAALESAAFIEQDPQILLDIALSYIPGDCAVARAVVTARRAYHEGVTWQQARRRVMEATPHYVSQYAPPNIGFQVIGWLYGQDFGNTLCMTVNCGYDTDCTGATVGALLGILGGTAQLPKRWTAPLGETIATNASWGGLQAASQGNHPIPATLTELTNRICALGERFLVETGALVQIRDTTRVDEFARTNLVATIEQQAHVWALTPLQIQHTSSALAITVEYDQSPVIVPGEPKPLHVQVHNSHPVSVRVVTNAVVPAGWSVLPAVPTLLELTAGATTTVEYVISAETPRVVQNTNTVILTVQPQERPLEPSIPIALIGARRWLIHEGPLVTADEQKLHTLLSQDTATQAVQEQLQAIVRGDGWRPHWAQGNALLEHADNRDFATISALQFIWSTQVQVVHLGIPATCARAVWVNGHLEHAVEQEILLRPNYDGDGSSYCDVTMRRGWNNVLITYSRTAASPAFAAHVLFAGPNLHAGIIDLGWTQFPWESQQEEENSDPL